MSYQVKIDQTIGFSSKKEALQFFDFLFRNSKISKEVLEKLKEEQVTIVEEKVFGKKSNTKYQIHEILTSDEYYKRITSEL